MQESLCDKCGIRIIAFGKPAKRCSNCKTWLALPNVKRLRGVVIFLLLLDIIGLPLLYFWCKAQDYGCPWI